MFESPEFKEGNHSNDLPLVVRILCAIAIGVLGLGLIGVLMSTANLSSTLPTLVQQNLAQSGVQNPVTAVLLNFRSYDTLLEIGVLLIVAVAMLPDSPSGRLVAVVTDTQINPMLEAALRWLVPMIVIMAGYMLWTGAALPGGAFQSGALLAGAGVLIQLSGRLSFCFTSTMAKLLLTIGLITFMLAAVGVAIMTGVILQYPTELAAPLILLIESAATISIATILLLLYNSLATQVSVTNAAVTTSTTSTTSTTNIDKEPKS